MIFQSYYHGLLEQYTIIFGTLFNNIVIKRTDAGGNTISEFKVPLAYSSRDKLLAAIRNDPDDERQKAMTLPRMGFEIVGMDIALDRMKNKMNKYRGANNAIVAQAVPYDISFKLSVMANREQDALKIVEQIVPYFTPSWNVTADLLTGFPDNNIDLNLRLNSVVPSVDYQGETTQRRLIVWEFDFILQAPLFGPVSIPKKIKIAKVNIYDDSAMTNRIERVHTYPGLDANGDPTSNSAIAIPYLNVDEDDDYGYVVEILNE